METPQQPQQTITSQKPPKIAFLFLTRGDVTIPAIWQAFFKNADPSLYSIVVHPKFRDQLNSDFWGSPNTTLLRPIPTAWGTISLVKATLYLLKVALRSLIQQIYLITQTQQHSKQVSLE
jgi:hypothetical protein